MIKKIKKVLRYVVVTILAYLGIRGAELFATGTITLQDKMTDVGIWYGLCVWVFGAGTTLVGIYGLFWVFSPIIDETT